MSSGITVDIDQPALTIDVTDTAAIITAGNFVGISIDTLNTQGPAGQGAFQFTHAQTVASSVWTITHNLGGYPNVTTIDPGGSPIVGTIDYVNANQLTITHGTPYAGTAHLS